MAEATIGARLKAARERIGYSQEDVARAIDVSVYTVGNAERNKPVKRKTLRAMAEYLELEGELFEAAS